jgi:aspartate-semialdehyde dehydrogenase
MDRLIVVGATGAVGTEMLRILEQRRWSAGDVVAVASSRSTGRRLAFGGGHLEVVALEDFLFQPADVCIFDVPDDVAQEWGPRAAEAGAVVVDNSAAWRMDDAVPLVVPEINPSDVGNREKGIIASPNCTTLAMVVPLAPLHTRAGLERLIVASYQATSGAGKAGVDELWDQTQTAAKESELVCSGLAREILEPGQVFAHPIALNVLPQAGSFKEGGFTSEELKLCRETRKIMGLADLRVTATCVRVPVVTGHGVAVHAEFSEPLGPDEARSLLREAPGVAVVDDPSALAYPTPLEAAGRDPCFVGRIRQDPFDDRALELFCVADNLRKGAALNAVQIAELVLAERGG